MELRIPSAARLQTQFSVPIYICRSTLCRRNIFLVQSRLMQAHRQLESGTAFACKARRKLRSHSSKTGQGSTASQEEDDPNENDPNVQKDPEEGEADEKKLPPVAYTPRAYDLEQFVNFIFNPNAESNANEDDENRIPEVPQVQSDFPDCTFLCTSITAPTVAKAVKEIQASAALTDGKCMHFTKFVGANFAAGQFASAEANIVPLALHYKNMGVSH